MELKNFLYEEAESISGFRVKGGNQYTINDIRDALYEKLTDEYALNVSVEVDKLGTGKLFDKSVIDCVVIKNLEHLNDYNYYVLSFSVQGVYGLFNFYSGGKSKNAKRLHAGEKEHSTITGMIIGGIRKAMVSDNSLENELAFRTSVVDAINEIWR